MRLSISEEYYLPIKKYLSKNKFRVVNKTLFNGRMFETPSPIYTPLQVGLTCQSEEELVLLKCPQRGTEGKKKNLFGKSGLPP